MFCEVVDAENVGVRHLTGELHLTSETRQDLGLIGQVLSNQLDGDVAIELEVARAHDGSHAPLPETLDDLVALAEIELPELRQRSRRTTIRAEPGLPGQALVDLGFALAMIGHTPVGSNAFVSLVAGK